MAFIENLYKQIGESDMNQDVSDWLSTGVLPLDKIISGKYIGGGFGVGRIAEVYGGASCGKTLMATMALIETQRKGGLAIYLDYEHAFSMGRAKTLGLDDDRSKWIYKQPTTAEEGFKITDMVCKMVTDENPYKYVTIVKDSISAMITEEEAKAGYNQNMKTRLSLAAFLSGALKQIASQISRTNVTLIVLNQTRKNPGVIFGDNESTSGGNALKFYASTRVKLSKRGKEKDEAGKIIGERVEAQVVKNKIFEPFGTCEYITHLSIGVDRVLTHIEALKDMGKLGDTKGWLEWDGKKYRAKDLYALLTSDNGAYLDFLKLFDEGHGKEE